ILVHRAGARHRQIAAHPNSDDGARDHRTARADRCNAVVDRRPSGPSSPAAARQLRAPGRGVRFPRRALAARVPRRNGGRNQPGDPPRGRRGCMARAFVVAGARRSRDARLDAYGERRGAAFRRARQAGEAGFRLLTGGARTAVPRHQTLRAAVEWSYRHLDDTEQTLFRRLSVFNGGFDIDAVEAVVATSPAQPATLLSVLTGIADKSLLAVEESPDGRARFRLLETLRQFGQEQLDELDVDIRRRHAEHYLRVATQAQPHLAAAAQDVWMNRLAQEQDNIRAALAWSLATEPTLALQLAAKVGRFWVMRGQLREGHSWLTRALDAAPRTEPPRARALIFAAWLAFKLGLLTEAEAMATEALSIATDRADRDMESMALSHLGALREHAGDYEQACAYLTRCLAVVSELGDRISEAVVLNNLALALHSAGDLDNARDRARQSLELVRQVGDRYGLAQILDTVARLELDTGRFDEASTHVREILLVAQVAEDAV